MKLYEKPEFELVDFTQTEAVSTDPIMASGGDYEYGGTGSDQDTGDHGGMHYPTASTYWNN